MKSMTNNSPAAPPQMPPKRRPGAPKGNRNAWKHGRYSGERRDLLRRSRSLHKRGDLAVRAARKLARARTEEERQRALAALVAAAWRGLGGGMGVKTA